MKRTDTSRRCILFARSATSGQGAVEKQIASLNAYAVEHGMHCVDQVLLDGSDRDMVRQHVKELVGRKATRDDFDTLLVTAYDRLSRSQWEGQRMLSVLKAAGIEVVTADGIPQDRLNRLLAELQLVTASAYREVRTQRQREGMAARRERELRAIGQPLRVLGLARSGDADPAKVEAQVKSLHRFAASAGMVWVDVLRLAGVGDRDIDKHVQSLIHRKRTADDFDTLIVADYSRLTRRGAAHLLRILRKLHRAGIRVISFLGDDHQIVSPVFSALGAGDEGVNRGS